MLIAALIGGYERIVIAIVLLLLLLLSAQGLADLLRALRKGGKEFAKAADEVTSQIRDLARENLKEKPASPERFSVRLFIAQGFGVGRIPFAPGTFGSFAALLWFALLVSTGNFWAYLAGCIEGIAFSIWLCDDAEKILGEEDPPSVVLDEIIAIPFCFLPWIAREWTQKGALPEIGSFFEGRALWMTLGIIVLFRVFDIWKPWPVRQSQRLPGGWGVTADDLLAAVYVAALSLPFVL